VKRRKEEKEKEDERGRRGVKRCSNE